MKKLFITLLLVIFISSISFSQTPVMVLEQSWGKEGDDDKLGCFLSQGGGPINAFAVDDDGNIYISDVIRYNRLLKFDKNGNLVKKIYNKTDIGWALERIKILPNGNILLMAFASTGGLIVIDQNGNLLFSEKIDYKDNLLELVENAIFNDNYLYYANKSGQIKLNLLTLTKELVKPKTTRNSSTTYTEKERLEGNILELENNVYFAKSFYKIKNINQQTGTTRSGSPYKLRIEGFERFPRWIGLDKDYNTYWYLSTDESGGLSKESGIFVMQILIYDKYGTLIKHFQTIDEGNFGGVKPALDSAGNLYFAQRWYSKGVAIWKYERDW